jgi:rhodanese-related sulfurtransferase
MCRGKRLDGNMSHYKTNEEQETITVEEFVNEWYNDKDYLLVDIREDGEKTELGAIKNAFNISMYDIPDQINMAPTYIVCIMCCDNGARSEQVVKYFKNNDYNNMFALVGGIEKLFETLPELKV